jgi:DNA 3'-phosphatase
MNDCWDERKGVLIRYPIYQFHYKPSLAAFSLSALLEFPEGKTKPLRSSDWKFRYNDTIQRLVDMQTSGASICIIDNIFDIGRGKLDSQIFKDMIDDVINLLQRNLCYIFAFFATKPTNMSKPFTRNWIITTRVYRMAPGGPKPSPSKNYSIYVGDLGGRVATIKKSQWGTNRKDKGYIDRAYCENMGMVFWSSEDVLEKNEESAQTDPREWAYPSTIISNSELLEYKSQTKLPSLREQLINIVASIKRLKVSPLMVIMIGRPGSGKTTMANTLRDILNSGDDVCKIAERNFGSKKITVMKTIKECIKHRSNIIIDGINSNQGDRAEYFKLAVPAGYNILMILFTMEERLAQHMQKVKIQSDNDPLAVPATKYCYTKYTKDLNLATPSTKEYIVADETGEKKQLTARVLSKHCLLVEYHPPLPLDKKEYLYTY